MTHSERKRATGEFSFYLAPSKIHGVGVFAAHSFEIGDELKLFYETSIPRRKATIPRRFQNYCVYFFRANWSPRCFGRMSVGWYLNHSKRPNVRYDANRDKFYAAQFIPIEEELTVDYLKSGWGKP